MALKEKRKATREATDMARIAQEKNLAVPRASSLGKQLKSMATDELYGYGLGNGFDKETLDDMAKLGQNDFALSLASKLWARQREPSIG